MQSLNSASFSWFIADVIQKSEKEVKIYYSEAQWHGKSKKVLGGAL